MSRIHPECPDSGPWDVLVRQEPDEDEDEDEDEEEDDGEKGDDDDETDDGYSE